MSRETPLDAKASFLHAAIAVESAALAEDLFGDLGGKRATCGDRLGALAHAFRRIATAVHPDVQPPPRVKRAHAAFVRANQLRDEAERKIRAGTYGDRASAEPDVARIITTPRRSYRIDALGYRGDLCDLHRCRWDTDVGEERGLFKVVCDAADSDLLENEARILRQLFPSGRREEKFLRYLPRLVDSFVVDSRRVVVLAHYPELVSAADVATAYPNGLDFRDVVWMLKRLLVVLGWVHRRGFVHGAVVPPHLLVDPIGHGARLVDWCYAVPIGGRVRAISRAHRDRYAPEILAKEPATPATDLFMAAETALSLIHAPPPSIRRFLESCLARAPRRRPDDAWKLHDELEELLRRLVGPPTYRRLEIPTS